MAVLVLFQLDEHDGSYDGGGHGFLEWFIIYYYVVTLTRTAHNLPKSTPKETKKKSPQPPTIFENQIKKESKMLKMWIKN